MGILIIVIASASLLYSISAYRQRGPIMTKYYFDAAPHQREQMKTRENYLFAGTIFLLISAMFYVAAGVIFFEPVWGIPAVIALAVIIAVLFIIMSVRIQASSSSI